MNNLFLDKTEFEKSAMVTYMDKNPAKWSKEIITHFLSQYPHLQNQAMLVDFKRKEASKGYAVGSLKFAGASVPVIIKQWQLAPMDVIMIGEDTFPLTPRTLNQLMTKPEPFKGVAMSEPKGSLALFGSTDLQFTPEPSAGMGGYHKYASFIDSIENVDAKAIQAIINKVEGDEVIKQAFKRNGTYDVIEKLAAKQPGTLRDALDSVVRGLDVDRQLTIRDARGNYFVKQANSRINYTWTVPVTQSEAEEFKMKTAASFEKQASVEPATNEYEVIGKQDAYLAITETGDAYITNGDATKTAATFDLGSNTPGIGDKGAWVIGNKATLPFEVIGISKTAKESKANAYEFISGTGALYLRPDGAWLSDVGGVVTKTAEAFEPEGSDLHVGDHGVWLIGSKVSRPFEVVGMQKNAEIGQFEIQAWTGLEKLAYYPIRPHSDNFKAHELYNDSFYVPGNAKFIKLGEELREVLEIAKIQREGVESGSPAALEVVGWDGQVKTAYYLVDDSQGTDIAEHDMYTSAFYVPTSASFVKIGAFSQSKPVSEEVIHRSAHAVGRDTAGLYYVDGPEFEKYGQVRDLSRNDTIWALVHCNVEQAEIEKAAKLVKGGTLKLASSVAAPVNIKDIADEVEADYEKETAKIGVLTKDLVKEASELSSKGSVDAVLSLGLLKKGNVLEFTTLIPQYEMAMSDLAKLLVTTRLGLTQLPEGAVKTAMLSLSEVVGTLKQIAKVHT